MPDSPLISPNDFITDPEVKKVLDGLGETIISEVATAKIRFGKRIARYGGRILRGRRLRHKEFEARLYDRWARPLDFYELCLYIAQNYGEYFNKSYGEDSGDHKFDALVRLNAGAVRVAGEVYSLLLSGFASGANARWRTLHEIAVVSTFIAQETDETAERYFNHRFVKAYEDALEYRKHSERLGEQPLSDEEMATIEKDYNERLARYGTDFRQPFGWARPAVEKHTPRLKKKWIGFEHLQAVIQTEHWKPYYRMASHSVHPSATFIRFQLGTREEIRTLLAGPSNADLGDPGQSALIALGNSMASLLIYAAEHNDGAVERCERVMSLSACAMTYSAYLELACKAFGDVHQELEKEKVVWVK